MTIAINKVSILSLSVCKSLLILVVMYDWGDLLRNLRVMIAKIKISSAMMLMWRLTYLIQGCIGVVYLLSGVLIIFTWFILLTRVAFVL